MPDDKDGALHCVYFGKKKIAIHLAWFPSSASCLHSRLSIVIHNSEELEIYLLWNWTRYIIKEHRPPHRTGYILNS